MMVLAYILLAMLSASCVYLSSPRQQLLTRPPSRLWLSRAAIIQVIIAAILASYEYGMASGLYAVLVAWMLGAIICPVYVQWRVTRNVG